MKFFRAKAWALLHDPPHKMWALYGTLKLTAGGHSEDAVKVWEELGLREALGDPADSEKIVHAADDLASTSDRWITNFAFANVVRVFEYNKLHNIFDSKHQIEIRPLRRGELDEFLRDLAGELKPFAGDPRRVYHALYALYEVEWAARKLPPSLADTRAPTHTLFDHVYATALTLNLLWPDGKVGGYAVMVDIPGIQRVVGAARKAGDFWAGSWMISAVTWLTLWPFVWEFGADVLLKPSPRYNPYYHATLWAQLGSDHRLWSRIVELYSSLLPRPVGGMFEPQHAVRQPVIPGTACLVLPRVRPDGRELGRGQLEREVRERFEKACELLLALASGEQVSEEPYAAFFKLLSEKEGAQKPSARAVVKLFKIIKDAEPRAFEGLLRARIAVLDVGQLYGEWLKVVKGEAGGAASDLLESLAKARGKLAEKLKAEEERKEMIVERIAERLTWWALFALLYSELSSRAERVLVAPKAWFVLKDRTVEPVAEFERFYDSGGGVGYITCTTCGSEPAVLRLSKKVVEPGTLDYSERAQKLLREPPFQLTDKEIDELKIGVKPGEALGPLCLIKRALYASLKSRLELGFESTEDVAFSFVAPELRGLTARLAELGGEGVAVKRFLESEVKSFDETLDQSAERARAIYERAFRELMERSPETRDAVRGAVKTLSSKLSRIYQVEGFEVPEDFAISFRSYYCILKADADNVRRLARGEIPVNSYLELLDQLKAEAERRGEVSVAQAFGKAGEIVGTLLETLKIVVPSPTYSLALSTALMVTALKGAALVEGELGGMSVFSGGDDDLALLPAEAGLAAVDRLRALYHGEGGFHRVGGCAVPAPVVYGKSFSLRFASILDLMADEVTECARLLEEVAKEAQWARGGGTLEKDALVLSESRGGGVALLPLGGGRESLKALEAMWIARLCGFLSANLPEDYERVRDAVEAAAEAGKEELAAELFRRALERNVRPGKLKERPVELLLELARKLERSGAVEAPEPYGRPGDRSALTVLSRLVEAYRVARGYP
jgi:CRISPR-associated protein Cmr2